MPPFVPRKRTRDASPGLGSSGSSPQPLKRARSQVATPRKATLFDAIDADATPRGSTTSQFFEDVGDDGDEDTSSLTSLSDDEFEDVQIPKPAKEAHGPGDDDDTDDEDDDEDIVFEDVHAPTSPPPDAPLPSGDLELTLTRDSRVSLVNSLGKKGPSKRERLGRSATHRLHVMFLMWHNAVRNSWLCDPEVQGILLSYVPPNVWDQVERWRRASGLATPAESPARKIPARTGEKGKGNAKARPAAAAERRSREWSAAAQRLEEGAVDMSHGDPLFKLMRVLSTWWKQRFKITGPGIRKVGYMSLERLDRLQEAFKDQGHRVSRFGEQIRDLEEFRTRARECNGSRDVGAQLFTSLIRALGLDARLVANLQPLGYGWTKLEEADPEEDDDEPRLLPNGRSLPKSEKPTKEKQQKPSTGKSTKVTRAVPTGRTSRRSGQGGSSQPAVKSDYFELPESNSDDDQAVEVPRKPPKALNKFDSDLEFPHYWTEVLSPVTNKYLAVDPIVRSVVATNRELLESLEPRGSKADKARQVMAYIVGFSQDGTAKDVTVRYLKRQVLPGRTKGLRFPVQKVPVHDKHGRVRHHDHVDWFKSVIRGYSRGTRSLPITEVDEDENSTDLKPAKEVAREVKEGGESLQYYKQSKEYVLERHLKREEALGPDSVRVKVFKSKGKGGQTTEENVYRRKDVVLVKSAETWHKQGRAPMPGERPLKLVPHRAATLNRKREIAEAEAASGARVLQGLYGFDQTDWIIPEPIRDGVIPKNEYGNIDLFVEHMLPEGAVHLPYRGVAKVCRRLDIDFAEAVIDFEFGHRMAVPVIQGAVVAAEHRDRVMAELARDEAERTRKEDEKRTKAAMGMWRRMLMGLRILERLREDYGEGVGGQMHIFGASSRTSAVRDSKGAKSVSAPGGDEDMAGGFLPPGFEEEEDEGDDPAPRPSSFFPSRHDDDDDDDQEDGDGRLVLEDDRETASSSRRGIRSRAGP